MSNDRGAMHLKILYVDEDNTFSKCLAIYKESLGLAGFVGYS